MKKIAFIGLGNVGYPMALNLIKAGYTLSVFDLDTKRKEEITSLGAIWASSAQDAITDCHTTITSLPTPQAVKAVVDGDNGIIALMKPGSYWIEMSTTDFHDMQFFATKAKENHIHTLEAPITGGCNRVWTGDISILVGGDEDIYKTCLPILRVIGGSIVHMGDIGTASTIKVITNMLAFVHLWASGEAMMLAKKSNIDLAKAYEAIKVSSGNSFAHETEMQLVLNGSYNVGFTMDLALKDYNLVKDLMQETQTQLPIANNIYTFFRKALESYGDKSWSTEAIRLIEKEFGCDLRAEGFPETLPGM